MRTAAELPLTARRVLGPGLATFNLRAPAAGFEVAGGLLFGGIAELDVVVDGQCPGGFAQPRRHAFVLDDLRVAFDGRDAALHPDLTRPGCARPTARACSPITCPRATRRWPNGCAPRAR